MLVGMLELRAVRLHAKVFQITRPVAAVGSKTVASDCNRDAR